MGQDSQDAWARVPNEIKFRNPCRSLVWIMITSIGFSMTAMRVPMVGGGGGIFLYGCVIDSMLLCSTVGRSALMKGHSLQRR